jgi:penicillin amidase
MAASLIAAVARCRDLMGDDPARWGWGRLHKAGFDHALSALGGKAAGWTTPRFAIGGSASTPMHTGYHPSDFRVTHGASFRMVVDFADLDASRCINAPGQSGRPDSPHFADLMPIWAVGGYVPMSYSADRIAQFADSVITLNPAA